MHDRERLSYEEGKIALLEAELPGLIQGCVDWTSANLCREIRILKIVIMSGIRETMTKLKFKKAKKV